MADSKYGRLFTEEDMLRFVELCIENDVQGENETKDLLNMTFEGRFPKDEPTFLLRAQDYCALAGIYGYQEGVHNFDGAQDLGAIPQEHKDGVQETISAFESFQSGHVDRMKLPD